MERNGSTRENLRGCNLTSSLDFNASSRGRFEPLWFSSSRAQGRAKKQGKVSLVVASSRLVVASSRLVSSRRRFVSSRRLVFVSSRRLVFVSSFRFVSSSRFRLVVSLSSRRLAFVSPEEGALVFKRSYFLAFFCGGRFLDPQPSHQALFKRWVLARRSIRLLLPQNPPQVKRLLHPHVAARRSSSPRRNPQIPKTHFPSSPFNSNFGVFPDSPKHKRPSRAKNGKLGSGFSGGLGLQCKRPHETGH